jgi:hypothetical protein
MRSENSSYQNDYYKKYCILDSHSVQYDINLPTLQMNYNAFICRADEGEDGGKGLPEMSVNFSRNAQCHIPEDRILNEMRSLFVRESNRTSRFSTDNSSISILQQASRCFVRTSISTRFLVLITLNIIITVYWGVRMDSLVNGFRGTCYLHIGSSR